MRKILTYWNLTDHSILFTNCHSSPQNSSWQSAIAKGFDKANSVFIVITSAKIMLRWLLCSKIYIQFTILISQQNYHLQTRDVTCTCYRSVCINYKKSDKLYIFNGLFILFLFVHMAIEQVLLSGLISSAKFCNITFLNTLFCFILLPFVHLSLLLNSNKVSKMIFKTCFEVKKEYIALHIIIFVQQ